MARQNVTRKLAAYAKSQPYKNPASLDRVIGALRDSGLPD